MSILFEESETPKKKQARKPINFVSGLKKKPNALGSPSLDDIFGNPTPAKSQSTPKLAKSPVAQSEMTQDQKILAFLDSKTELKKYLFVVPNTDKELTYEKLHDRAVEAAKSSQLKLSPCFELQERIQNQMNEKKEKLRKSIQKYAPHKYDGLYRRGLIALYYQLGMKQIRRVEKYLDYFTKVTLMIGEVVHMIQSKGSTVEIRLCAQEIESDLLNYENNDKKCVKYRNGQKIMMYKLKYEKVAFECDLTRLFNECTKIYNQETSYFPDTGIYESTTLSLLEEQDSEQIDTLQQREIYIIENPEAAGKVIISIARDIIGQESDYLQYGFLLFTRNIFHRLYCRYFSQKLELMDYKPFTKRMKTLSQVSYIGFGMTGNFIPERLISVPICDFPKENPYSEAVELLTILNFQVCPIEFCKVMNDALRIIQNVASDFSFKAKAKATGKVFAKSDHLLCLDDLFDITVFVFILAAPLNVPALLDIFSPYFQGLDLTAELQFAYTNINAIVMHVQSIDLDSFIQSAKHKSVQLTEIDPLNILG